MSLEFRIQDLNAKSIVAGRYVLYWMQQAQRLHFNHAFYFACERARSLEIPVVIVFGLTPNFPEANLRHYVFLFDGLKEVRRAAASLGIAFCVQVGEPDEVCLALASQAAMVVTDVGYLRIQRQWRRRVASEAPCRVVAVETDAVVPVGIASDKEEYSAATLRPKLKKWLPEFLVPLPEFPKPPRGDTLAFPSTTEKELDTMLAALPVDRSVAPVVGIRGGTSHALQRFDDFLRQTWSCYADKRNDPSGQFSSGLSAYLHFGQISPVYLALRISQLPQSPSREVFLEELVVRRELSMNFVFYNPRYDTFQCLPWWARQTLERHRSDPRPYLYERIELEQARTHDRLWNAAQLELVHCGTIHNYVRMYWGKKILEWSRTPEEAFATALYLNNKYALDGRDPNSFAGVAWCFGKHDRPWPERPIFGTIRAMTEKGFRRKFDAESYIARISRTITT